MQYFKPEKTDSANYASIYESKYENRRSWQKCGAGVVRWSSDGITDVDVPGLDHWKEGKTLKMHSGFRIWLTSGEEHTFREADAG